MNGVLNIIAALVLGGAAVYAGHTWTQNNNSQTMNKEEIAAFKANTISEVRKELADSGQCVSRAELATSNGNNCAGNLELGALEQPYAAGVALREMPRKAMGSISTQATLEATQKNQIASFNGQGGGPEDQAEIDRIVYGDGEKTALLDKPDEKRFFTENKRLIDKPDSKEFFTENKRLIDKPDNGAYFTDNKRLNDAPCRRADGSEYTGPGTAQDPFADDSPCLGTQDYANLPFSDSYKDPCASNQFGSAGVGNAGSVNNAGSGNNAGLEGGESDPCLTSQTFADNGPYEVAANNPYEVADNTPYGIDGFDLDNDPYQDPCLVGNNGGSLPGAGNPCTTSVIDSGRQTDGVQIAEGPQTPVTNPDRPVTLAQNDSTTTPRPGYTSPYQDFGGPRPGFGGFGPRPSTPRGGSDYTVQ